MKLSSLEILPSLTNRRQIHHRKSQTKIEFTVFFSKCAKFFAALHAAKDQLLRHKNLFINIFSSNSP